MGDRTRCSEPLVAPRAPTLGGTWLLLRPPKTVTARCPNGRAGRLAYWPSLDLSRRPTWRVQAVASEVVE